MGNLCLAWLWTDEKRVCFCILNEVLTNHTLVEKKGKGKKEREKERGVERE